MPADSARIEWHVNFADYNLFGYYGGNLFAQDEMQVQSRRHALLSHSMQVMEHPSLGSIREALLKLSYEYPAAAPYTRHKV